MLMLKGLIRKGDIWWVRVRIPADVRHEFGGKAEYLQSLRTRDSAAAVIAGAPIVADVHARITAARSGPVEAEPTVLPFGNIHPQRAAEAIERWRVQQIDAAYAEVFNQPFDVLDYANPAKRAAQKFNYDLDRLGGFGTAVEGFDLDEALVAALNSQGLQVTADHPAITRLRKPFFAAQKSVAAFTAAFYENDFSGWPETGEEAPAASVAPAAGQSGPAAPPAASAGTPPGSVTGMKLKDLMERFISVQSPPEAKAKRMPGYVRRLSEALGDPDIGQVTIPMMDDFLLRLEHWPKTQRPMGHLTFDQVIEEFGGEEADYDRLEPTTIYANWLTLFAELFAFAVQRRYIAFNPVILPKKPTSNDPRFALTPEDIAELFSRPLFTGAASVLQDGKRYGYCTEPGSIIVKDAAYWLPILSLFHGNRLEEFAGAKAADIKQEHGVWFLDLRERQVKNVQSRRTLPLHPKVIALGFLDHVKAQPDGGYLFAELPHDPTGKLKSSRQFTKWWGLWRRANAKQPGLGIGHRQRPFHSFRHTFILAGRNVDLGEYGTGLPVERVNLLTGHAGQGSQNSRYAQTEGKALEALQKDLAMIDFPTFPSRLP